MVTKEDEINIGDEVEILNTGFFIGFDSNIGNIKTIKSFDNIKETNYLYNINFTDGKYGASHSNNWNKYLKLVKKKDVLSSICIW